FFTQWDLFNKRYSTWAGISKLVYYPENYVDPTLRIGQTKMMDTLLQSISQNSVNSDTIEDAFKTYLTSFEQIANLEVISGYHDSVTLDDGMTYFIGRNPSDKMSYYWRSADHSKIKDAKMAANAWTEWTKIENGLNPYNGLIRPVIFNSRLYIAWIERVETAKNKTTENIEQDIKYSLNLSHIRYDGSWSSPVNYALQDDIKNLAHMNFYLSYSEEFDNLMVIFYQMKDKYSLEDTQFEIYYIDNELNFTKGTENKIEYIYVNAINEFDILDNSKDSIIRTVNNTFIRRDKVNYSISRDPISSNLIKDSDLASLHGSLINNPKVVLNNNNITCSVSVSASVKCEIKKSIEVVEQMRNNLNDILSFHGAVQDDFKDIYYAEFKLGTEKEFLIGQPSIINKYINKVLYLFIDVNKNYIYIYIADEKNDYKLDHDFTRKLFSETTYIGISGAGERSYDFSKDFVEDKGFFIKNMNGIFDVEKILAQKNFSFNFFMSFLGISYGIYGKGVRDLETLNNWKVVHENTSQNIKDIIIELGTTHNQKTYSLNDWSNNTKLNDGDNSFNSKEGKLILDIPDSEFKSTGKTIVTVNIKVKNKQSEILSEKRFSFEVKQIISANESNTIRVKINSAMAQYMSMNIANRPMLVRLNTLFARQLVKRANIGIERILTLDTQRLPEPPLEGNTDGTMDFNGANALYFWELFYYTPMMIANVMLDGQNYDEASRWLRYVFSPNGYIENGIHSDRVWNSQPLLSDTAWDKDQLDSSDPDAVAQTDPMHYKLATFMKCLDILIARGDSAYRVLERDTLNEAKMWYMQALQLLGDETELTGNNIWSSPTLMEAASKIAQPTHAINEKEEETSLLRTANSLTQFFLPQINEKLAQYRDTLKIRLFNLRHNLSIDGQPLSLAIYATPADPKALQNAVVNQSQGGSALPNATMPTQRFPVMLNSAKSVVSQLMQFGNSLANIIERQDAQALSELLTTQGSEIILQNMKYQVKNIEEFTHNEKALNALRAGAQLRLDHYSKLYDENISTSEQQAMDLYLASSVLNTASTGLGIAGAVADLVPNIYGLAFGGSRFGGVFNATSMGLQLSGSATRIAADRLNQSETYRRRREEWKLARDNAKTEVEQFDAKLDALKIRKQAASLQLDTLKLQQQQTQEHLTFLQNKFTNKSLYNWLRGKLMAIYKPFYDLTVSHCCMAELAYQYDLGETQTFIRPGAWQGTYSGLMAGESLMHNLTQMENSYLEKDKRVLEMTKIVSLDDVYQGLGSNKFNFNQVGDVINGKITALGTTTNGITLKNGQLQATIKLSDLAIDKDYPAELGQLRRIKQISVSLPVLVGAYQNIRAVLNYGGSAVKPRGCGAIAISHGMNDSGQFQLNFNDDRYLPFEGIPVNDNSSLTLSFPDATDKQKEMLLTLNDIILHINYTIR
ncbi:neuraminidase-like domain-containing protein, partial [Proteus myxofaciens]